MAYVAVKGGKKAIEQSVRLLKYMRTEGKEDLSVAAIRDKMKLLVDRIMSESGLYSPDYAALSLKQCEGSPEEAVFIMRAYRSTLSRNHYTRILSTENMRVIRRISASFKDIPGGQILGPTYDYVHRLLDFDILFETQEERSEWRKDFESSFKSEDHHISFEEMVEDNAVTKAPRVSKILESEGLMTREESDETEISDVTLNKLKFPAGRSAVLQTLTRADTGFISGLAYSSLRGFGAVHPTVGELKSGWISIEIPYMGMEDEDIFAGEILITEVETFVPDNKKTKKKFDEMKIGIGYGCVFGRNDTKAISMSILDRALEKGGSSPVNDQEFVLLHGDCLEMNGFISHLKLPHYITFQSKLDSLRNKGGKENE